MVVDRSWLMLIASNSPEPQEGLLDGWQHNATQHQAAGVNRWWTYQTQHIALYSVPRSLRSDLGANVWRPTCNSRMWAVHSHIQYSYWCLVGNGWDWGVAGMIIDSDYGSFPQSLPSTSKYFPHHQGSRNPKVTTHSSKHQGSSRNPTGRAAMGRWWVPRHIRLKVVTSQLCWSI